MGKNNFVEIEPSKYATWIKDISTIYKTKCIILCKHKHKGRVDVFVNRNGKIYTLNGKEYCSIKELKEDISYTKFMVIPYPKKKQISKT